MVLERMKGVLTWTIDRYLGTVVEGVNADSLKTDLWRGHVELTDLALREDILQTAAGLPLRTVGKISKVGVKVSQDRSIKFTIEGVRVTVSPLEGDDARLVRLREIKAGDIRRCVEAALARAAATGTGSPRAAETGADAPTQGYLAQRISAALLENVQLTVADVQVVYDHGSAADEPLRLELGLGRLSITEAPADAHHLQGVRPDESFTRKLLKVESITAAVKSDGGGIGGVDDEEDELEDEEMGNSSQVLDVPELSMTASVGSSNAEIVASLRLVDMKVHARQPQLRALYLLAGQWERADARAKQAAAQMSELAPPSASMQRLYIRLHQQQRAGALSALDEQTRVGLEDKISAANIAALRIEAEQLTHDEKAKKASEGWFTWANRVATTAEPGTELEDGEHAPFGSQPEPEPEPEVELFTREEFVELNLRHLRKKAELLNIDADAIEDARDSENPKESMIVLLLEAQDAHVVEQAALAEARKPRSSLPSNAAARWTVMWQFSNAAVMLEVDPGGGQGGYMESMLRCDNLGQIHIDHFEGTVEKTYRKAAEGGVLLKADATLESLHVMDYFTTDTRFPAVFSSRAVPSQTRRAMHDPAGSQEYPGFLSVKYVQDTAVDEQGCVAPASLKVVARSCQVVCNMQFLDELNELFDATVDPEVEYSSRLPRAESILTGISSESVREREMTDADDAGGDTLTDDPDDDAGVGAGSSGGSSREHYRREWAAANPAPETSKPGMVVEVVVHNPVVVLPEKLNKPRTMALLLKGDRVLFNSESQRHESKGNAHPLKERLRGWVSRIDKDSGHRFSCLDAEMPFSTQRLELREACVELTNYDGLDSTTIRDVISEDSIATAIPQWDGSTPPGKLVIQPTECSMYVMLRQAETVLSQETMPKFLVLLDFRKKVELELTEEIFVAAMGVFHGVFYSEFGQERDAKALERIRPPPGGELDVSHFQVLIDAKEILLNASTALSKSARNKEKALVRIVAEDLNLQFDTARTGGGMDVRVSMQGLAARDCYSGVADTYLVWVKKMRARNQEMEPVHIDYHAEGTEIDPDSPEALTIDDVDGVKKLLKVHINNSMKVSWIPETIQEIMRIFNRGIDRLFIPQADVTRSHSDGTDSPLNSPDRETFPGNFLSDIDHMPLDNLAAPSSKPGKGGGRAVSWQPTGTRVGVGPSSDRATGATGNMVGVGTPPYLRAVRPRSPNVRPPSLARFIEAEPEDAVSTKVLPALPTSGESRYILHVAEAAFSFEYPVAVPGMGAEATQSRPLVAVMQLKDSTVDMLWDFNENSQTVDVALNQVALSKTEMECRTDPSISFSSTIGINYSALLDPLRNDGAVKAGHAFKTVVNIPSLRYVCTPTSSPLVEELYSYIFYSFLYPLTQYDGEPVIDKSAPPESNFMIIEVNVDNPRVLVTGSSSRKGSYFFEAKLETLTVSSRLERRDQRSSERSRKRFRGDAEIFNIALQKFSLLHPGSGDVVIAPMDMQCDFSQCFLQKPYAWTKTNVQLPPLDISLPDSLLKFITIVARDHIQAAADNPLRGEYTRFVDASAAIALSETSLNLPSVTLSYLKDGIRSASCGISALSYTYGSDHGVRSQSLNISDVSVDAPHQHVLTRILNVSWIDESSADPLPEKFILMEGSPSGNIAVRVTIPSSRAVLHADSMMYLKSILESLEEKEKGTTAGGLDDIVEEPDSPRAGDRDSTMDDWDASVTLGSRSHGSEGEISPSRLDDIAEGNESFDGEGAAPLKLRTRSIVITAREMELVIPETNRTDLLLFKFGVTAEMSEISGIEIRSRVSIQELSASMGHWNRSLGARSDPTRYAEIQLDSILLREFETKCEYYRRQEVVNTENPALSIKEKSTLTIVIGHTQVVASADQVFSSMGMVGNLLEEFLGDDDEFDDHVFAGDDPNAYEGDGFDDFDGGSLMSATTGRSGSKLHHSTRGSHMSSKMSEYSDDWQTVASESDHGSYALRSRHSAHARSSGGSSDGESESGISQSFHSAENDQHGRGAKDREELFSERLSQYSWERLSYDYRSNSGSDFSRNPSKKHQGEGRVGKGQATASIFGVKISLPSNITLRVTCAFMSLQLTSDPFGQVTPLWQMLVSEVSFAAKSKDAIHTLVTAKLTVQVKYFNLSVLCWESAVEPLLLHIDANHDAQGWIVDLNSERNLNVNVSEALFQALEPLTDTTRSAPNSSAVETAPYRLKNMTGEPIQYTIGTEDSVDSTPATLSEGATADYKIKEALGQRSDDADFTPRYVTFRFEETLTERVCIDKPGKHMFSLQSAHGYADRRGEAGLDNAPRGSIRSAGSYDTGAVGIFCEISKGQTKGTREIVFGSPVTVNNKANVEIELLVEKPMRSGPHSHATEKIAVLPGETQYIPVQYTRPNSGAALRVRPIEFGNDSYWSQTTFNLRGNNNTGAAQAEANVGSGEGQRVDMVCGYEDQSRSQFCISAAMRVDSNDGDPDTEQRVITLYPKLVISNLLPTALNYRFIDKTETQVMELGDETNTQLTGIMIDDNGNIEPNDSCTAFLHMESFKDWLFQVKIGDHDEWSQPLSVKAGAQRVFVLNDDSKTPLEVVIYGSTSNQSSMELSISCPYWIINKTEDELSTRPWLNSLARKQKTKRQSIEKKVTRLFQDYTAPFSCETDRFSIRVQGFDWSHGISLQTVGTTDFYLSTAAEGMDDMPPYGDDMMDDDFGPPHGSMDDMNSDQDLDDLERGGGVRRGKYGSSYELDVPMLTSKRGCHLGVNITTGSGPLSDTKIFTFTPFFRMDNQTGEDLLVRQRYSREEDIMELRADMHGQAFQWSDMRSTKRVQIKFANNRDEWAWSGGIDIARHTGEFFVPLSKIRERKATKMRTQDYIIRGEVKNTEQGSSDSMRMVVFNKEDEKFPPYLLFNACNESVNVRQVGTGRVVVVQPGIVRPYACEEPFSAHRIEFWAGEMGHAPSMSLRLMDEQAVDVRATQIVTANRGGSLSTKLLRVHVDCNGPVAKIRIEQVKAIDESIVAVREPSFAGTAYDSDGDSEAAGGDVANNDDDTNALSRQANAFTRQGMMENVEEIAGGVRRRGKDLLSGMKDVALETRGFVVKGFAQGGSVSKIARIGTGNKMQVLNVGMRFTSVRISFIGAVTKANKALDRPVGDGSATSTSETVRSEILLVVLDDVRMRVVTNDGQHQAELAVRYAQIDNQSHKTKFPVLLSIAAEETGKDCMIIHVDRSDWNDRIEYFEYAAVQIQDEIHVQLEEEWLVETQSFLTGLQEQLFSKMLDTQREEQPTVSGLSGLFSTFRNEDDEVFGVGDGPKAAKNLYFDVLRLEPIRVKLDVIGGTTNVNADVDQKQSIRLPTVSNLQIRFTELQEKSPYGSAVHIVKDMLYAHYRRQFMRKIYKVLGGYLQGAQRGLVINLGRGVIDCVRMPIIMTRKQVELMQDRKVEALYFVGPLRGLIKGTTILVSNTVLGLTEFCTDVVSFFGAFFMKIIYGEHTYKLRRRNLMRSRPRHVFDGMLLALLVTSTAVLSAVYDVTKPFWEPFTNHEQQQFTLRVWVEDLFQGIVGALLKPVVGILDGLIMLLNGIGATVGVFGTNKTRTESARKRQPRLFDVDGQLRPVNPEESECQNVLTQLGFINEVFIDKVRLEEYMVIVTSERLIWYLWDEKHQTEASRAQKFAYRSLMVLGGLSIGVVTAIELHFDDDRVEERKDAKLASAAMLGVAFVFLIARLSLYVKGQWRSPWKVGKVLFQSNFLWQVSWKNVEAVALDLPEELREAVGLIGGGETPRWRHSMRVTTRLGAETSLPLGAGVGLGETEGEVSTDAADGETLAHAAWRMQTERNMQEQQGHKQSGATFEVEEAAASGSEPSPMPASPSAPPASPNSATKASTADDVRTAVYHDDVEASEVWAAATEKAKSNQRSAKERKAHMPRLRFRLRQYEKYPRLDVSTAGAVTNFMGLSLQATNPANFMWDTIYKRSERQISCSEESAMGLLRLYDSLSSLKERHHFQSGGTMRTPGPLAAVLENVQFTDRMDTIRDNAAAGQEWAWTAAVPGSAGRSTGTPNASASSSREQLATVSPREAAAGGGALARSQGSHEGGMAHAPRGMHNLSPTVSPLRRTASEEDSLEHVANPLAAAAAAATGGYQQRRHHAQPHPLRTGGLPLPPTVSHGGGGGGGSGSVPFDGGDHEDGLGHSEGISDEGDPASLSDRIHALQSSAQPVGLDPAGSSSGPSGDSGSRLDRALAFGGSSIDDEVPQGRHSYGAGRDSLDLHHNDDVGSDDDQSGRDDDRDASSSMIASGGGSGSGGLGTPRQAPLFMAAVVDDAERDLVDDRGDGGHTSSPPAGDGGGGGGGGGGGSAGGLPRVMVDAPSAAIFEQETHVRAPEPEPEPEPEPGYAAQAASHDYEVDM